MTRAVKKAAKRLVRDFGEVEQLQVSRKGPADFVSAADRMAERTLHEELHRDRPDFGFLMEESGEVAARDPRGARFIIDPLDGTTNFLHGIPHFAISVGLEGQGKLQAAIVYDPIKDEMFWAERGGGAFMNNRRLRVSARETFGEALIGTGMPFKGLTGHDRFAEQLARVMPATAGVRRMGAAALDLAYVAAGRLDGFWERGLKPWDVAAGALLVREAGGKCEEWNGGEDPVFGGTVIAANPAILEPLRSAIGAEIHKTATRPPEPRP